MSRTARLLCTFGLVFSWPSVAVSQSALRFTLPFGPYTVGFSTVSQYDFTRTLARQPRAIQTSVWYPAVASASIARMRYREYLELVVEPGVLPSRDSSARATAARAFAHKFKPDDEKQLDRELSALTYAYRNAPQAAGKFPVIVYGASYDAPSVENATLMEYLASYGYVVISSPSFGAQGAQTSDVEGIEAEARDMEFLIGYAHSLPAADMNRLAVMGFSWGGIANVLVAMRNPGVSAVVCLDGTIVDAFDPNGPDDLQRFPTLPHANPDNLTVPALFLRAKPINDDFKRFPFFDLLEHSDAMVVTLSTLKHRNFGEHFNRLKQDNDDSYVADTKIKSAGYERIALYARSFLDANFAQSAAARTFLSRSPKDNGFPPDEVTIERKRAQKRSP